MSDLSRDELIARVKKLEQQLAEQLQFAQQREQQFEEQLAQRDAIIATQHDQLEAQRESLQSVVDENRLLKRALFGRRRERHVPHPDQRWLFEGEWCGPKPADTIEVPPDEATDPPATRRRRGKRGRIVIPDSLPRKEVVHPLREEDIPEHLRGRDDLRRFRKKIGQYIELVPSSAYVVEEFVEVLAADNEDQTRTEMISAIRPPRILNSYAGPGLLAEIVTDRFADYLPFYRVEERISRLRLSISRGTLTRWVIELAKRVLRLVHRMRSLAIASRVAHIDETPVDLLLPGHSQATTAYIWTLVGDADHPYNVFYFTENRSLAGPERILQDFSGVLVSDAYTCYESLQSAWSDRMKWACCFAHARRKFEALEFLGSTRHTTEALAYFRRLFDMEDEIRSWSDEARHAYRQQYARPLMASMKHWMDMQLSELRPKHPLRGAIQYMTKRWDAFTRFLESGEIAIENNAAERSIKLPVMAKKSHLFFASLAGGNAATVFYTLTASCRRLHVDPSAYLRDVFTRLPQTPDEALDDLLPDRWLAAHPQHRLEIREREAHDRARRKNATRSRRRRAARTK